MLKYLISLVLLAAAVGCGSSNDGPSGGAANPGTAADHAYAGSQTTQAGTGAGADQAGRAGSSARGNAGAEAVGGSGQAGHSGAAAASGGMGGAAATSSGAAGTGGTSQTGNGTAGAGGATAIDMSAELFDPEQLPRFDITLASDAMTALGNAPDVYVHGTLRYGSTMLQDVGVRIKGEASLRTLAQKAAFKIKLDEFVANQSLLGMRRVTLNNMVSDPSFVAERLAYQVYRAAGLPAPRCNSALVYLNDEFYGVYANVESEDKTFLRRWFTSDAGNLYEDGQVDLKPGNESFFDLETNETKNDRSDLTGLITAIDGASSANYLADLDATLDTEHFLRFSALEAAVDQWDGYSYTYFEPNNFRLYHNPTNGKFRFIPWGMDMAMKPFPFTPRDHIPVLSVPRYENMPGERDSGGLIFVRCLQSTSCKAHYIEVLRDMIAVYDAQKLSDAAAHHYAQIKDHVYAETRKEITNQEFEAGYQSLLNDINTRTAVIRDELQQAGF